MALGIIFWRGRLPPQSATKCLSFREQSGRAFRCWRNAHSGQISPHRPGTKESKSKRGVSLDSKRCRHRKHWALMRLATATGCSILRMLWTLVWALELMSNWRATGMRKLLQKNIRPQQTILELALRKVLGASRTTIRRSSYMKRRQVWVTRWRRITWGSSILIVQAFQQTVPWLQSIFGFRQRAVSHLDGMVSFARLLHRGAGIKQDSHKACDWLQKAADQKHSDAMNDLGVCFANVTGRKVNKKKAAKLYKTSAEAGNIYGMWNFGFVLDYRRGIRCDKKVGAK